MAAGDQREEMKMKKDDHPVRYKMPSGTLRMHADGESKQGVSNHAGLQSSEASPWGMHSNPVSLPI